MAKFSLLAMIGANTSAYQRGIQKAETRTQRFGKAVRGLGPILAGVGFASMARNALNMGERITNLSRQLNTNAEALQVLQFAQEKTGASSGALERAIRNVQIRTQQAVDGNKSYSEALARLGIDANEFIKLPTERKLEAIAKASAGATDGSQAYADVARILGERAGPELQGVLDELAKGFESVDKQARDAGNVMDAEFAASLEKASTKLEQLQKRMTVVTGSLAGGFLKLGEAIGDVTARMIYGSDQTIEWTDAEIRAQQASYRRRKAEKDKARALRQTAEAERAAQQAAEEAAASARDIMDKTFAETKAAVEKIRADNLFDAMAPEERVDFLKRKMKELEAQAADLNTETVDGAKEFRRILKESTDVYKKLQDEQAKLAQAEKDANQERESGNAQLDTEVEEKKETAEEAARRRARDPFGPDSFVRTGVIRDSEGMTQDDRFKSMASNFSERFDKTAKGDEKSDTQALVEETKKTNTLLQGKFVNE